MSILLNTTPYHDGFWMPAEFEPHDGCWMLFPERLDVWRDHAKPAQEAFVKTATAIAQFEPVTIGALPHIYDTARRMMPDHVTVVEMAYDDAWMRDCGPSFVVNGQGEVRGVDWIFNAWGGELGGLYAKWDQDERVAQQVLSLAGCDRYKAPIVVEGGAIHVDGEGTLITTKSCLLNPNRNPNRTESEMTDLLCAYTGAKKVIWLDIEANEETDGHIDGVCAFVKPSVLVITWTDDETDEIEYNNCRRVYEQLSSIRDAQGRAFELHKLPAAPFRLFTKAEAATVHNVAGSYPREAGSIIGGSYANFYIANGGIVLPTYDHPHDEIAHRMLDDLFVGRRVVDVPAWEIAMAGGMVHCITQQQPSAAIQKST